MKRYRLLDDLMLSFLVGGEQHDFIMGPGDFLETDGDTVWVVSSKGRFESITTPNVIDIALEQGLIEEA